MCALIRYYILPNYIRPKSLPEKKYSSFDNTAVSFCHSTVAGVGSLIALQCNAKLLGDLAGAEDDFGWHLVAISTGIIGQLEVLPV